MMYNLSLGLWIFFLSSVFISLEFYKPGSITHWIIHDCVRKALLPLPFWTVLKFRVYFENHFDILSLKKKLIKPIFVSILSVRLEKSWVLPSYHITSFQKEVWRDSDHLLERFLNIVFETEILLWFCMWYERLKNKKSITSSAIWKRISIEKCLSVHWLFFPQNFGKHFDYGLPVETSISYLSSKLKLLRELVLSC